jgi:hypothetical protein
VETEKFLFHFDAKKSLHRDGVGLRGLHATASARTIASESDEGFLTKEKTGSFSIDSDTPSYSSLENPLLQGVSLPSIASPDKQFSEPSETTIFLDWDDTLFPATGLFRYYRVPPSSSRWRSAHMSDELESEIAKWRKALQEFLYTACALSDHCVIVTNAHRPWIETCVRRFAPDLLPLFSSKAGGLRVVYAGEVLHKQRLARAGGTASSSCGDGCLAWWRVMLEERLAALDPASGSTEARVAGLTNAKLAAMRQEAEAFHAGRPGHAWENVLSIGDMCYEHNAVQQMGLGVLRTKALTLPTGSSLSELTLRLRLFQVLLPVLVRFDGNIDLDLNRTLSSLPALARALCIPQLCAIQFPDCSQRGLKGPLDDKVAEEALDEVAMAVQDWFVEMPVEENENEVYHAPTLTQMK